MIPPIYPLFLSITSNVSAVPKSHTIEGKPIHFVAAAAFASLSEPISQGDG